MKASSAKLPTRAPWMSDDDWFRHLQHCWRMRTLYVLSKKFNMTTKWEGHSVRGYDRNLKQWVTLYSALY